MPLAPGEFNPQRSGPPDRSVLFAVSIDQPCSARADDIVDPFRAGCRNAHQFTLAHDTTLQPPTYAFVGVYGEDHLLRLR